MSDLISRQGIRYEKMLRPLGDGNYEYCDVAYRDEIDALPSAQPERKKGKWIPFEYGDDTWHKCTACGVADNYISIVQRPNGKTGRLESVRNFCPNCGAYMRGEEDE